MPNYTIQLIHLATGEDQSLTLPIVTRATSGTRALFDGAVKVQSDRAEDFRIQWVETRSLKVADISFQSMDMDYFVIKEACVRINLALGCMYSSKSIKHSSTIIHSLWPDRHRPSMEPYRFSINKILHSKKAKELIASELVTVVIDHLVVESITNSTLLANFVELENLINLLAETDAQIRTITLRSREDLRLKIQLNSSGLVRMHSTDADYTYFDSVTFLEQFLKELGALR